MSWTGKLICGAGVLCGALALASLWCMFDLAEQYPDHTPGELLAPFFWSFMIYAVMGIGLIAAGLNHEIRR